MRGVSIIVLILLFAGLLYFLYQRGGEQPVRTVEQPVMTQGTSD